MTGSYPHPTTASVTAIMKGNRRRDTRPEVRLRSALHARGHRFRCDYEVNVPGLRVRPDIVFTKARVAVFVDGCFWHGCELHRTQPVRNQCYWGPKLRRNRERDLRVTDHLESAAWVVIRIWEHVPQAEAVLAVELALQKARVNELDTNSRS